MSRLKDKKILALTVMVILLSTLVSCTPAPDIEGGAEEIAVLGLVSAGDLITDASLKIYSNGEQIYQSTTNDIGSTFIPAEVLPSDFRVVVENGYMNGEEFSEVLMADYSGFNPESDSRIYVNLVTTMVSKYLDENPDISLVEAAAEIKSSLNIPEWFNVGSGALSTSQYFNYFQFFREADEFGGIDEFIDQLLVKVAEGETHGFQEEPPLQLVGTLALALGKGAAAQAGGIIGKELLGRGLRYAGVDYKSFEDKTGERLEDIEESLQNMQREVQAISSQLTNIESQLGHIQNQIEDVLKKLDDIEYRILLSEFNQRMKDLEDHIDSINSIERDLTYFILNPPSDPERIRNSLIQRIERSLIDKPNKIHHELTVGPGGSSSLLKLYNEMVVKENRFISWEISELIDSQFNYLQMYQEYLLLLRVEYYHAIEPDHGYYKQKIDEMIETHLENIEEQNAIYSAKKPIPRNMVIDTKQNIMLYVENPVESWYDSSGRIRRRVLSDYYMPVQLDVPVQSKVQRMNSYTREGLGFTDWQYMTERSQVESLLDGRVAGESVVEFFEREGWPLGMQDRLYIGVLANEGKQYPYDFYKSDRNGAGDLKSDEWYTGYQIGGRYLHFFIFRAIDINDYTW